MSAPLDLDWGVVVPVKGGPGAKSRLRIPARGLVAAAVGLDTIETAIAVVGAARVAVVSADPSLAASIAGMGPVVLVDDPGTGLDGAVRAGVRAMTDRGAGAVAALLGDHPSLTPAELRCALEVSGRHTHAFVPDATGTGSAMVTSLLTRDFRCAFGAGSAARHDALGLARLDLDLPGLRLDVDDLGDLEAARALGVGPRTRAALLDYASVRAGEHPHDR